MMVSRIASILKKKSNSPTRIKQRGKGHSKKWSYPKLAQDIKTNLEILANLPTEEKTRKSEDIKHLIEYYGTLTSRIESRRDNLYNHTLRFLAVLVAIFGILVALNSNDILELTTPILVCVQLVIGIQILFSVVIVIVYETQSRFRYPFLRLKDFGNKWKWFYYGNEHIVEISRQPVLPSKDPKKTDIPYLEGLKFFVERFSEEKLEEEICDNIQQLYLLQVHNYYKNRFYLQLTNIQLWSFGISIGCGLLYWLLHLIGLI